MFSDADIAKLLEVAKTVKKAREDAIEECARVAETIASPDSAGATPWEMGQEIAAAIRALKDKP